MDDSFATYCPNRHPTDWDINKELHHLPRKFEAINTQDKPAIARLRWFCKYNLFYLCYHVLGYKDMDPLLHTDVCNWIDKRIDKPFLILLPREHFKSSIITVGLSIQDLLRDNGQHNLITSATPSLVSQFSLEIRTHLESSQILKVLFPEVCYENPSKQSKRWNDKEMIIKRDRKIVREPSLTFLSAGSMAVGYHFTRRIYDDIVNYENTATPEQLNKLHQWLAYTQSLGSGAIERYVGTRYHFNDIYEDLLEQAAKGYLDVYVRKAIENGKVIFPGKFTIEKLNQLKVKQGSYIWNCQYMNSPIDEENAAFLQKDINWIEDWKDRDGNSKLPEMNIFIIFDPNFSEKEDKSMSNDVVAVIGVDYYKNKFLLDYYAKRGQIDEVVKKGIEFIVKYNPSQQVIHIEDCAVYKYLKKLFFDKFDELRLNCGVCPVKIRNRDKFSRIMRIQPELQTGKWWIPKGANDVIDELVKFPKFKRRDIVDTMSYIYDIGYEPEAYTAMSGQQRMAKRNQMGWWENRFSGKNSYMVA